MKSHKRKVGNGINGSPGARVRRVAPGSSGLGTPGPLRSSSSESPGVGRGRKGQMFRVGTLNVGTMTGRGMEVVTMMEKRRVRILCVQEVRWRGKGVKMLGNGYKMFYVGEKSGRNGVGIVVEESLVDSVVEVIEYSSRLMMVKLCWEGIGVNVVSAYGPQAGLGGEVRDEFWEEFDELLGKLGSGEKVVIGGSKWACGEE